MLKKKILVVDDEADLVEMVAERLEANDFSVIKAYDGQSDWIWRGKNRSGPVITYKEGLLGYNYL